MPRPLTVECLSRLAAFDTTSRNSNLELIAWAEDFLRQHGAETDRVTMRRHEGQSLGYILPIGSSRPYPFGPHRRCAGRWSSLVFGPFQAD